MHKSEIQQRLKESHLDFIRYVQRLPQQDFLFSYNSKWTAGQQLEHIVKSSAPVNLALGFPHFLLKTLFGKANRHSRTYDALVEKYQSKLAAGGKSTARFLPKDVQFAQREELINKLSSTVDSLIARINKFSEKDLDTLLLPHPLLGKLTLREMLFFTIYHVGHHQKQTAENLLKRSTP